ncbi:flagellar hook-length control FliK family protein [Collimonas fungivorans]|uniref:Flagellar hook-length control FliK family protein n=1 Tax=Collimonas fungivorans TaxID=158899 RepID=A0A127P801_9BURK|nr:flagellar hook-length control protein FliK [Collimonas fungivorans]AMO93949.1 flagellar hook-length control FliK family protein [Collimonas fungivorans]
MSLLVSSSTAALQAAPSAGNAVNNANSNPNAQQDGADNFGKVLDRSLASADKPAEKAVSSAKPTDRAAPRRQASSDKDQDPGAVPALAFLVLPQAGAKAIEANPQSGSDSPPPSAAEGQLNAAIAAASGKPAVSAAIAAPATETADTDIAPAGTTLPAAAQLATQAGPADAAPSRQSAAARKEAVSGEYANVTQNAQQLASQVGTASTTGQQAAQDDAHANKHDQLEKSERQDNLAAAKTAAGPAGASANTNANEIVMAKAAAGSIGQPDLTVTAQANPAVAHNLAAAATAAASSPPAAVKLALLPAVGSDGWGAALGKQVVWMGNTNNQSAELHLNPPDLGPLKVTLTISDNQAQAMFVSAHQSVRTALEAALPQLRSSLAESGINLGNTSVSADTQQPQQQQQGAFTQHQGSHRGSGSQFQATPTASELNTKAERSAAAISRNSNGKVDIFA